MLGEISDVAMLMRELEAMGLLLWLGDDGVVHGRMRDNAIPFGARPLIEALQGVNEQAAELLRKDPCRVREVLKAAPDAVRLAEQHGFIHVEMMVPSETPGLCDAYFRDTGGGVLPPPVVETGRTEAQ